MSSGVRVPSEFAVHTVSAQLSIRLALRMRIGVWSLVLQTYTPVVLAKDPRDGPPTGGSW